MRKFISTLGEETTSTVNDKLFDRTKETSIVEYIISGLKVIESLPYIKFTKWEHVTDMSQVDLKLNRKHIKNRAILKDKDIEKIISIRDTAQEMLRLEFVVDYDGDTRYIKKNLLIPSYIDKYHMLINGKEVLPQKQIVDTSTYNQKRSVKLKTTLTPIDIYKEPIKNAFETTEGDKFYIKTFILNLFTKEINPLYYYLAKFGLYKTILYFGMKDIVDVTNVIYDTDINYYFQISKEMFVEVDKRYFDNSNFIQTFTYMIYDVFQSRIKFENIDSVDYWLTKLGAIFTTNTKNQLNKGKNVLVSFGRILDDITKSNLRLDKKNLQSTHSLVRWLLQNYSDLRKKNNHDLETKRVRCNEVTAFYFIQSMAQRINQLLNKKKLTIEAIERVFNWNPDELFKIMMSSKNTLLKYDADINSFELLNALRYSLLGIQGISGGKNIANQYRDIYPSHIGRLDINGLSHGKNLGLTGFLVPKCKIYGNGFFAKKSNDPDNFNEYLGRLKKILKDKTIDERKSEISILKEKNEYERDLRNKVKKFEKRDGLYVIHRMKNLMVDHDTKLIVIGARNKPYMDYVKTYKDENGISRDENGYARIERRKKVSKSNGLFIISKRKGYTEVHRKPVDG